MNDLTSDYNRRGISFQDVDIHTICQYSRDQDPVSDWAPRKAEIQRIVNLAKGINPQSKKPLIIDVGCGSGLVSYLLALTGEVEVVAFDPNEDVLLNPYFVHPNLAKIVGDSKEAVELCRDCSPATVINSYMPEGVDLTPHIRQMGAKSIVYIMGPVGSTGIERISYHPGQQYINVYEWEGPSPFEVETVADRIKDQSDSPIHTLGSSFCTSVMVQLRRGLELPDISEGEIRDEDKYVWEQPLESFFGSVGRIRELFYF
tara:strand:+ start:70 stop:846 length:777 start_codon:yes stop_codon:yes gene_type:complete